MLLSGHVEVLPRLEYACAVWVSDVLFRLMDRCMGVYTHGKVVQTRL